MEKYIPDYPSSNPPANINLFAQQKFKVVFSKYPDTNYFTQSFIIPSINLGAILTPTNAGYDAKYPGDKIDFEDLTISFVLDEDFKGYEQIADWMFEILHKENDDKDFFSDLTLHILTNNYNVNRKFIFYNTFPDTLSSIPVDTRQGEDTTLTYDVIFKFSHFELK